MNLFAQGGEDGMVEPLWFVLNMTERDLPVGRDLAQDVAYTASCGGQPSCECQGAPRPRRMRLGWGAA